ncbi:MAG TPA: hypothetical protein DCL60_11815 [Armatimonadetes bacterium]|jgi:hypothetical protein|nr:hypothetical protein [Armatimonadota bacterium]
MLVKSKYFIISNQLAGVCVFILMLSTIIAISSLASTCSFAASGDGGLPIAVCGRAPSSPLIDGSLQDACWKNAPVLSDFAAIGTRNLAKGRTRALLLHDDKYLYIGLQCGSRVLESRLQQTHTFKAAVKDNDNSKIFRDDSAEIFISCGSESGKYYHLAVNGNGALWDARGQETPDSWNSGAVVKSRIEEGQWCAEIALPLKSIGASGQDGQACRFNVCRSDASEKELSSWSPALAGKFGDPDIFGFLKFSDRILPARFNLITARTVLSFR